MRFLRRAFTGLFLVSLTVGLLAFAAVSVRDALQERAARDPGGGGGGERTYTANITRFEPGTVTPILTTYGEVRSRRTLEVRTAVAGRVVEMDEAVEDGGIVEAGQLLFRIDPAEAERAVSVARADLQDATAELDDAEAAADLARDYLDSARSQAELREAALRRQRDLRERGVSTSTTVEEAELAAATARQAVLSRRQSLNDAEARVAQAETQLARAEIARDEARRTLEDTEIRAAFSGVLSEVSVVEGGLVSPNETLATLIDPDRLEAAFRVSTADYARLTDTTTPLSDRDVTVRMDVEGLTLGSPATITRESGAVSEGQTGRRLYARIAQPQGFRPGDFVRVVVSEPPLERVARLPAAAIDAGGALLAVDAGNRLERVQAELMRRQGDEILVRADDLAGRDVVAERSQLLGGGIKISPNRLPVPQGPETENQANLLDLTEDRRAALIARVEEDQAMTDDAKERVLAQLREPRVPARIVSRIEAAAQ